MKGKLIKFFRLSLCFLLALLCTVNAPVLAKVSTPNTPVTSTVSLVEQGKILYDAGRFAEAVQILQQAVPEYRQKGESLRLAASLSNLSLAYQQLGAWNEAQQAITDSLNLLEGKQANLEVLAQALDIQGRLQLAMGKPEAALSTWQRTAEIYRQTKNFNGEVRSQINQAQAWRTQGFYRRAVKILLEVGQKLQSQPDSLEKAVGLRSLGDALMVAGLTESRTTLEQSLGVAQRLQIPREIAASFFSLGNNARARQQTLEAINYYQQAVAISPSHLTKIQAQINQFSLLLENQQLTEAQNLIPAIQEQINQLPPSRAPIYAQINFAQSLIKVINTDYLALNKNAPSVPSTEDLAKLLAKTIQQAHSLGDNRAEAYATLSLGNLYEQNQQWAEAKSLTEKALVLAQGSNAADIIYRLEWQLGRLLWTQKDLSGAIAAYDAAVETLKSLRSDLVAVNQEVQFNFRDSVEPIYRQSVELLLQSQQPGKVDAKILDKARQRIEALQLAELDNFFREACLQGQAVLLDKVVDQDNPTAAIFYPIILPQQIQVIVKIPHQPLRLHSIDIEQPQVDKVISELRRNLVNPTASKAIKTQAQQVYNWLIKPVESELAASGVKTLVFVPDGLLRNLPLGALYDGKQYLIEKYAIALSVGLQLLDPKPIQRGQLRALTAGLTQPPPDYPDFSPLPAIKAEVDLIASAGVDITSLLDQQFTREALEKEVNNVSFNVVHLATHGQFSSRAENTFILAADGPINVIQFDTLLRGREQIRPNAVELLVLSACQTAAGDNRAALGLAGAAVRAGARSTVASLWQIDDESTALLVGEFYKQLKTSNTTKAEALRRAQLKLLNHPNYGAPSYWSAYVMIGNWM